ncbi:MFS transporter [Dickeya sp. CFBP 2040]|uniref:MFS transporter n=1 Tax=Dickeya sp. CFBP 2040 TaxID=2718531 RepID=UPI001444EE43|nr:MFS transporter [Dickeya sp. CFBP 2040]NKI73456.1 MFS transporter [Dickeya sp. CFBP 2040]
MAEQSLEKSRFKRDYYTLYLYIMSVVCGIHQAILGSITPFLRDELTMSKVIIGWHFSLYAIGMFVSGFIITHVASKASPKKILLSSSWAVAVTVAVFALPLGIAGNLILSLVLGLSGGAMQIAIQEALARHHTENSGIAITEGCIFSAIGVFIGPLVIGYSVESGAGWRIAMFLPLIALLPLLCVIPQNIPTTPPRATITPHTSGANITRLPLVAYLMFGMIFLGIAAEWGIGFWGAQFLEEQLSLSAANSVAMMAVFFGGTIAGRIVVSRLLVRYNIQAILLWTIILSGMSMLLLWLVPDITAAVIGLTVAGACLGNFFPLILSIATWQPPELLSKISAGATQSVGLALLLAPLFLGKLGEDIGLIPAMGALIVIPPVMLIVDVISRRLSKHQG